MRRRYGALIAGLAGWLGAGRAWALEKQKETTSPPPPTTETPGGQVATQAGRPLVHDAARDVKGGYVYLLEDKGYFLPPLADVSQPTNYMRGYVAAPVAYATNVAKPHHVFWDVGFGEEFYVWGRTNRTKQITDDRTGWYYAPPAETLRWPTGFAAFITGDMHMLLDFTGFSAPVIDAEFRIGGGLMGRGFPIVTEPGALLSHVSWRLKLFHESTHIGDEYLDDIRRRQLAPQGGDPPTAGFIHANISYLAAELLLALDGEEVPRAHGWYWRVYGGYRRLFLGPYDAGVPFPGLDPGATIVAAGERNEGQFGAELRYRLTPVSEQGARRPDYVVLASDTYVRKQYDFAGTLANPRWLSLNVMAGVEWGDWADDQMTFRILASYYDGLNPHGQFRSELLRYVGLTFAVDY
jgi:hypothetical protein